VRRVGRRVRGTPVSSPRHGGAWSSKPDDARRPNRPTRWRPSLCEIYWCPLYAYVRRQGQSTDDAQDLTQGFFAHLLDKQTLRAADRERGHFRSFLLASLKHFLAKQWRRDAAQKRGGGRAPIALDFDDGETRYRIEPSHESTPEKLFERQWALTLLARALATLRSEFEASGKAARFASLKMYLGGEKSRVPYRELAGQLETSEGAVKVAIHRMRRRYRAILREEIRHTVDAAEDVDDELRRLFDAVTP